VGMAADIAVFDPRTIIDHATYEQPTLESEGVRYVLVNGRFALRDGKATGEKAGRVLMRVADLPSRPMGTKQAHSLSVNAKDFRLQLGQAADGKARGSLRFSDPQTKLEYRLVEAGLLQTYDKWASLTAVVRAGNEERAAFVVLDGGKETNAPATIRVEIEGGGHWEAKLSPDTYKISVK